MGMKINVEIVLSYPDLSMHKHVDFLRYVLKDHIHGAGIKEASIVEPNGTKFLILPTKKENK